MNISINSIKRYTLMILKYILAIIFYLLVMNELGAIVVVPIFRSIFDINTLHLLNYSFSAPFNFISIYYKQTMGLIDGLLQMAMYFILFSGLIAILYKDINKDVLDYNQNKDERERSFLMSLLIYLGLNFITGLLVITLSKAFNITAVSQNQASLEAIAASSVLSYITLGVTVVIMGPLVEELIFRKALFKIIPNDILAIILSSILFGLMHTIRFDYSWQELIVTTLPYLSSGIAFGLCYKLSNKNIIISYVLHAALNLVSLFMMLQ